MFFFFWELGNPRCKFIITRLLGRFAPIFYFNCEHVLFVHRKTKQKSFKIFKNLMKIEFWWSQIFEILIIHKPFLGPREVPHKIWAWSVQPFWLDTNRQTDKLNLYIDTSSQQSVIQYWNFVSLRTLFFKLSWICYIP